MQMNSCKEKEGSDAPGILPKYTGVWMSLILRPDIPVGKTPQLTLLAAVAVVQGIQELTGLQPQIKWPNETFVEREKSDGNL